MKPHDAPLTEAELRADAVGSYYVGVAAIGERVKAGQPVPAFFKSATTAEDGFALTPEERHKMFPKRKSPVPRGYAALPGTGPDGETCGTCKHHVIRRYAKNYHKCELMSTCWTGGGATDIRVRSPACSRLGPIA